MFLLFKCNFFIVLEILFLFDLRKFLLILVCDFLLLVKFSIWVEWFFFVNLVFIIEVILFLVDMMFIFWFLFVILILFNIDLCDICLEMFGVSVEFMLCWFFFEMFFVDYWLVFLVVVSNCNVIVNLNVCVKNVWDGKWKK